jgi:hypothetical protein
MTLASNRKSKSACIERRCLLISCSEADMLMVEGDVRESANERNRQPSLHGGGCEV